MWLSWKFVFNYERSNLVCSTSNYLLQAKQPTGAESVHSNLLFKGLYNLATHEKRLPLEYNSVKVWKLLWQVSFAIWKCSDVQAHLGFIQYRRQRISFGTALVVDLLSPNVGDDCFTCF